MKIYLKDITDRGSEYNFDEAEAWVRDAVSKVDEPEELEGQIRPPSRKKTPAPRPIEVHFELREVDDVILANGRVGTEIRLFCSRCVQPFGFRCDNQFSALYSRDPAMAGVHEFKGTSGIAKSSHGETSDPDLEITYLTQDFIDLSEILTEQLMLQIPFQPLCSETCKGICQTCGADLNRGRCACDKVVKSTPFSVLKDFQAKS